MKAKKIFEKFEEESDPIAGMGIGGIELIYEFERRRKKLDKDIEKTKERALISWDRYIRKLIMGKTITAEMEKLATFDKDTMERKTEGGRGKYTITVVDVHVDNLEYEYNGYAIIAAEDHTIYKLSFTKKVYIHK